VLGAYIEFTNNADLRFNVQSNIIKHM